MRTTWMKNFVTSDHRLVGIVVAFLLMMAPPAIAGPITVTIQNLAPMNGNVLTPVFVGFHNGTFDIYNPGSPASPGLQSLAEDGLNVMIAGEFMSSGAGSVQGSIFGAAGPIAPGEIAARTFTLDGSLPISRFFSYATMVIPSNDAFIANGNPTAFRIFDNLGNFQGADFTVLGSQVLDAGTEVNTEIPAQTAFFGQVAPNTGIDQNGVVGIHPGFLP
ncbi:MAG: spondin domain-containing protein, partial [Nitrospirales bacterium]